MGKTTQELYDCLKNAFESGAIDGDEEIILLQDEWSYCRSFEIEGNEFYIRMKES